MDHPTIEYLSRGARSTPESRGGCPPEHRFADLVEWAGTQPWSAGKVGLSGVSRR